MNYVKRNILSENEIKAINKFLRECEWEDGLGTAPAFTYNKKNNLEAVVCDQYKKANKIVMSALDKDINFFEFCIPDYSNACIFSKTGEGGFYRPHHDDGVNGHFSTTVFLSDPKEYVGGELCLFVNGREKIFKPTAGTAVTYETGILHQVNEVTSGERLAAVFWTKSIFDDPFTRQIFREIGTAISKLERKEFHKNFKEALEDPRFILEEVQNKLIRRNLRQPK